jgi:hypothetical protein
MQRAARAMGGNLVLLMGIEERTQTYVTGYGVNAGSGQESVPGASATGWVLVDKKKTSKAP